MNRSLWSHGITLCIPDGNYAAWSRGKWNERLADCCSEGDKYAIASEPVFIWRAEASRGRGWMIQWQRPPQARVRVSRRFAEVHILYRASSHILPRSMHACWSSYNGLYPSILRALSSTNFQDHVFYVAMIRYIRKSHALHSHQRAFGVRLIFIFPIRLPSGIPVGLSVYSRY